MGLSLTVLGCDGSYASAGGACSGYLVRSGSTALWLDAGAGTLANLQRHLDLDELDGIVLSHAHPDHWVDVLPFHNVARYIKPRTGLPVWSPARVRELAGEVNGDLAPAFTWESVSSGDSVSLDGLTITFSRTDHPGETLAVRVDDGEGASIGYSADTGPGWSLSELGPDLDLALCEATLAPQDERRVQHLSARQAGASAHAAGAGRLVLTHLQPGLDAESSRADATAAFGGPVDVAAIDDTYQIGTP
ncbi:MAG TPA: MBL fold metallo-hydrolase [Acidimicrobiales bacterium]|nr:MBL fold metallo-hydrolase [Acidimicrobiales bacterium]